MSDREGHVPDHTAMQDLGILRSWHLQVLNFLMLTLNSGFPSVCVCVFSFETGSQAGLKLTL